MASLLDGRNVAPLDQNQVRTVVNTFFGVDRNAAPRYDPTARSAFVVRQEEGETISEIVFGPDIYPGTNIVNPNASLSMKGAVMHELCHWYRHEDLTELNEVELEHIDEAQTSLAAVLRFPEDLNAHEVRQLVSDAFHRLQLYVQKFRAEAAAPQDQNGIPPVEGNANG